MHYITENFHRGQTPMNFYNKKTIPTGTVSHYLYTFKTAYKEIINHPFFLTLSSKPTTMFGYALDLLVTVSFIHCCTSTSALSTSSSSRGLTLAMGYLILRGASRLDAFSVYPVPAWLLCYALGRTTDTPAASPSRSSRTKDSSSQISYAHAG